MHFEHYCGTSLKNCLCLRAQIFLRALLFSLFFVVIAFLGNTRNSSFFSVNFALDLSAIAQFLIIASDLFCWNQTRIIRLQLSLNAVFFQYLNFILKLTKRKKICSTHRKSMWVFEIVCSIKNKWRKISFAVACDGKCVRVYGFGGPRAILYDRISSRTNVQTIPSDK